MITALPLTLIARAEFFKVHLMEVVVMATYKPGEKAPDSGELVEIGPRGGKVEDGRVVVIERGETIPPTSESGNEYRYKRGSKTTH